MQDERLNRMTEEMAREVSDLFPQSERVKAAEAVKRVMAMAVENNEILSLTSDEVLLLTAYREWKVRNVSGSATFHWRKP